MWPGKDHGEKGKANEGSQLGQHFSKQADAGKMLCNAITKRFDVASRDPSQSYDTMRPACKRNVTPLCLNRDPVGSDPGGCHRLSGALKLMVRLDTF